MKRAPLFKLVCLFVFVFNITAFAGNLEPSGPPTGTMKPLDQVEPRIAITSVPYTINTSGSYYLTQNMTASGTAITVNADDVTIDLRGFTLTGPGASSGVNYGIYINTRNNIEIRNGTIRYFGYHGIYESSSIAKYDRIIEVRSISNGYDGIYLKGDNHLVKDCEASGNGTASTIGAVVGISVGKSSVVNGNVVCNNGPLSSVNCPVNGISISNESTASNNMVSLNGSSATGTVCGIYSGYNCKVSDNTVISLAGTGITTQNYTMISGNSVEAGGNGISVGTYCQVVGNIVRQSGGYGISMGDHSTATENTSMSNTGNGLTSGAYCMIRKCTSNSNTQRGISTGDNCTISDCTASQNTTDGIGGGDHVTITGNNVTSNANWGICCTGGYIARNTVSLNNTSNTAGMGGISVSSHSQVKENTLEGNNKNNIYVAGSRSSVEGNVMSGSDYGIKFNATGNVYLNNRATANGTNYSATGNTDGGGNVSF